MRKITETLINESTLSKPKKEIKYNFYSFNQLFNSVTQSISYNDNMDNYNLQNFRINKNSDSQINQKKIDFYLINRTRKIRNNLNSKTFNKTDHTDIIRNQGSNKKSFYHKNNNKSVNYSEKYSKYNNRNKKKKKININLFNKRNNNYYKINNKFNINGNQNSLFNTEEDINDIKYFNINEDNEIKKQINNNNLDNKFYGHVKNHSAIIFNK